MLPGGGRPPTPPQLTNGGKPSWYVLTSLACLFEPPPLHPQCPLTWYLYLATFLLAISLYFLFFRQLHRNIKCI